MLDAKDLRIGNLVLVHNHYVATVERIGEEIGVRTFGEPNSHIDYIELQYLQAIELTEEWLLRFGFEKKTWFSEGIVIECVYYQLGNFIIYLLKDSFEIELIRKDTKQFNLFINFKKEVHILQNVFHSLIQTEITLKDEK